MDLDGAIAPPMENGELVFDAPWQGRVFGMARALCEQGLFDWDEFRECLIAEVGDWDKTHAGEDYHYYDRFLAALSSLLAARGVCTGAELAAREHAFAARPHDHDH